MARASVALLAVLLCSGSAAVQSGGAVAPPCPPPRAGAAYLDRVDAALRARADLWGNRLLAAPQGPTFAGANLFLAPLFYARGPGGRLLTASGAYYLPFAAVPGPQGSATVALHV